jgi:glycosyltransferase involved in cell wall biosynthesis
MADDLPNLSVIVPTFARPAQLDACLNALARLHYAADRWEIVVVDDGSPLKLAAANEIACQAHGARRLAQPHGGPAIARNLGAAQARGDYLVFTDDDCRPAFDWLLSLGQRLNANPTAAIGGRTINALASNPYSSASQALVGYLYGYYNPDPDCARFFASNNLALPAETFHSLGGFQVSLAAAAAEDRELCDRWLFHNQRLIYAPEAVVYHAHDLGLSTFCQQHFNYGRGAYYYHQAYARRRGAPVRLEPPAFYLNLLRYLVGPASGARAVWRSIGLAVLSQLANLAGFVWQRQVSASDSVAQRAGGLAEVEV